jgi:hypothetical protein
MPPSPSPAGYKPRLEMPVIAPPPAANTGTPLTYYQGLQLQVTVAVSGPNGEFADVTVLQAPNAQNPPAVDPTFFAMTGGFVTCYPMNSAVPSPDNFAAPAGGVILLKVWSGDVLAQQKVFPPDVPALGRVYYVGFDATQTNPMLRIEVAKMSLPALKASWKDRQGTPPSASITLDDLIEHHLARVMLGSGDVFVDGGTPIGKAVLDSTAAVPTYKFAMRMTNCDAPISYVSPLPILKGAPYYAP